MVICDMGSFPYYYGVCIDVMVLNAFSCFMFSTLCKISIDILKQNKQNLIQSRSMA